MSFVYYRYSPPITSEHYNCVGLALELWNRLTISLEKKYPGIGNHICVVSCEEDIDSTPSYVGYNVHESGCYRLEKEHALMCLKVEFRGRVATLLCDPGYHVSRVVAITSDGAYPNTGNEYYSKHCFNFQWNIILLGWFVQSEENGITKEYNYSFVASDKNFVEWKERTTSNGKEKHFTGVIYVGRPFLTAVDVTERRNLVYNFRSILSRDQKGHLIAGVYFKVALNNDEFTIFYQNMGKQRIKMNFSAFCKPLVSIFFRCQLISQLSTLKTI